MVVEERSAKMQAGHAYSSAHAVHTNLVAVPWIDVSCIPRAETVIHELHEEARARARSTPGEQDDCERLSECGAES